MCRLSYCTLVLIAASCYIAVSSHVAAKALQGTKKSDLANRIKPATEARQKRAMGEYKELNDIIDELEENSLVAQKAMAGSSGSLPASAAAASQPQEFDLDNMPPLTYYLLLQKLRQLQGSGEPAYRVRTPRLGRSIDFQQLLDASAGEDEEAGVGAGAGRQFVSRMMKKSVPFKPRLGKRAQVCGSGGD